MNCVFCEKEAVFLIAIGNVKTGYCEKHKKNGEKTYKILLKGMGKK